MWPHVLKVKRETDKKETEKKKEQVMMKRMKASFKNLTRFHVSERVGVALKVQ